MPQPIATLEAATRLLQIVWGTLLFAMVLYVGTGEQLVDVPRTQPNVALMNGPCCGARRGWSFCANQDDPPIPCPCDRTIPPL